MFLDILLLIIGVGAVYYLLRPQKQPETVQELLDYKDITPEGIIELPNYNYRLVIEVEPINMALRSFEEQSAIWLGFKNMINSLNVPATFLIQTRYMNLKNYLDELERFNSNRSQHIKTLVREHIEHLSKKAEGKHIRDRRYFIILKIDGSSTGVESGIEIENQLINTFVKSLPNFQKSKTSPVEIKSNAKDVLLETSSIVISALDAIGIRSIQLDKKAVLDMLYQTFNRDLAPYARLEEADSKGMFSLFVTSDTPEIVSQYLAKER